MQDTKSDWTLTDQEKYEFITLLTNELATLRAKAGIPQDELSRIVGISRQTYGAIERKDKVMSWGTYLSLLFFFEHNVQTRQLLRQMNIFPEGLISHINNGDVSPMFENITSDQFPIQTMIEELDDQGLHSIKTLLMVEYARCKKITGDEVIKSFNGQSFDTEEITEKDISTQKALRNIREKKSKLE